MLGDLGARQGWRGFAAETIIKRRAMPAFRQTKKGGPIPEPASFFWAIMLPISVSRQSGARVIVNDLEPAFKNSQGHSLEPLGAWRTLPGLRLQAAHSSYIQAPQKVRLDAAGWNTARMDLSNPSFFSVCHADFPLDHRELPAMIPRLIPPKTA